jgi:glycosyltransferase involved in cell wall biosynthesis
MNASPHILFISYDGMTDPLGQSQVLPYLIGLTKHGFRFTILSCEKEQNYRLHKDEINAILKPYPIKWAAIRYHKNPPVFSSVFDVLMLKQTAKKLHKKHHFDMVHTRPGVPALIGLWMKKKSGVKFLNDIREFYADSRVDGGIWNTKNLFYRKIYDHFKGKENEAVAQSDGIVCLTWRARKIISEWPSYDKKVPIRVIPCSVDMELFDPAKIEATDKIRLKNQLGIHDEDIVISYLGSIGSWYLTDELLQFFKIIEEQVASAKFLFISPHAKEKIIAEAKKFGIKEDKIIVCKATREEVPALISLSKFSVFFIKPCYSKQSSSPTKHGEIMAMGIPVITNTGVGDVAEIVKKYSAGITLKDLDEKEFNAAITIMKSDEHFENDTIRQGALEYYNLHHAVTAYKEIYSHILD